MLTLALALTVVAPVAASADTMMASSFNTNLTVGSRGPAVVALQSFLISKGFLTVSSTTALGYFGGLTKSALAAYQSSKGITPSAGYFGPVTRASVIAESTSASTGSTSTTSNTTTTTTTTTGGTTVVATNTGVEGTLDIRLASNPADNASVRTQTDVPVYGIEFRARISDVTVQTVDLQVNVSNGSSNENPATLINTVKVWDGSNVIATVPVSLTTFTKDQNQIYYYRVSGLNFVVPKDTTKTLTFSVSSNSIDTDRVLTIDGYQSSSVRAVSGNGVSSFYSIDGSGYTRTHTFKKPGSSTLTLTSATSPLRSQNYRVNGSDSLQNVTLGTFNLKSETGASTLLTVNASTTVTSGTAPSTLYLYQGSTLLKSKTVVGNSVVFDNLDTTNGSVIAQNAIQTYTIKADFPANTVNATQVSASINSVVYQTPNGNTATASGSAVSNASVYVYSQAASIALAGTPTIVATNGSYSGATSTVTATFPLSITALGGTVNIPTSADVTVTFSNGQTATVANTSVVTIPNSNIADGSTAAVTVTAKGVGFATGLYNAAITQIKWNATGSTTAGTTTQAYGLEDFKTSAAANLQ